jgi:hypothetical protein
MTGNFGTNYYYDQKVKYYRIRVAKEDEKLHENLDCCHHKMIRSALLN